jgi:hypothetical protein
MTALERLNVSRQAFTAATLYIIQHLKKGLHIGKLFFKKLEILKKGKLKNKKAEHKPHSPGKDLSHL